jgi:hypothetical protein
MTARILRTAPGRPRAHTTPVPDAIEAIEAARSAATDPAHGHDRDDALSVARDRIAAGTPLDAVILDAWRAGFVTGHLDSAAAQRGPLLQARLEADTLAAIADHDGRPSRRTLGSAS